MFASLFNFVVFSGESKEGLEKERGKTGGKLYSMYNKK